MLNYSRNSILHSAIHTPLTYFIALPDVSKASDTKHPEETLLNDSFGSFSNLIRMLLFQF